MPLAQRRSCMFGTGAIEPIKSFLDHHYAYCFYMHTTFRTTDQVGPRIFSVRESS